MRQKADNYENLIRENLFPRHIPVVQYYMRLE